jgi:hypothetical protein
MNIFHTISCPICKSPLAVSSVTSGRTIYSCTLHYFHSAQNNDSIYIRFYLPEFSIVYHPRLNPIVTDIYKVTKGDNESDLSNIKYVCTVNYPVPIDLNDLKQSSKRIQNLIVFS